jgi:hypothetical protein
MRAMSERMQAATTKPPPNVGAPTLQLLAWVADRPRTYAELMDAWRSTCPRLSVWEDATIDGLVRLDGSNVMLTSLGRAVLGAHGRTPR